MSCATACETLELIAGATFVHDFYFVDDAGVYLPLTNVTTSLTFKDRMDDPTPFLTANNAGLTVYPNEGRIYVQMPPAETIQFTRTGAWYDLTFTYLSGNNVITTGRVEVTVP